MSYRNYQSYFAKKIMNNVRVLYCSNKHQSKMMNNAHDFKYQNTFKLLELLTSRYGNSFPYFLNFKIFFDNDFIFHKIKISKLA